MRDFITRPPWSRWFRTLLARRAARQMAIELLEDGPAGEWRPREPLREERTER